jgi:hypothetical protein
MKNSLNRMSEKGENKPIVVSTTDLRSKRIKSCSSNPKLKAETQGRKLRHTSFRKTDVVLNTYPDEQNEKSEKLPSLNSKNMEFNRIDRIIA